MRLTLKLTLAIAVILTLQFALYSYFVAERLSGFFERDMKRDALRVGQTLSIAVARTWQSIGEEAALALVDEANNDYSDVQIRFVWITPQNDQRYRPALTSELLMPLQTTRSLVHRYHPEHGEDHLFTYFNIPNPSDRHAAIELRQSFERENWFTTVSVLRVGAFLIIVVTTTALLMWTLGVYFVGKPIKQLCQKARMIGQGRFSDALSITTNDEIGELAKEINLMSDALDRSRQQLEEETASRIKVVEQLRHADRLSTIGTMASSLAHELGTPLTVASGHLASLQIFEGHSSLQQHIHVVNQQIKKMSDIVHQLLNYSRRKTPDKKPMNVSDVVSQVVAMLRPFGEKRGVEVLFAASSSPVISNVDPTQLEQVIVNLMVNAIQSMDSGALKISTTIDGNATRDPSAKGSPFACIEVIDNGIGMSEEQVTHIFDPFFTTKSQGQGTGMGLSIAQGIVVEHGGWITVTSKPGQGSCFSVFLPIVEG